MKRKHIISFVLIVCLVLPCLFLLSGCFLSRGRHSVNISSAKEFVEKVVDSEVLSEKSGPRGARNWQKTYYITKDLDFSGIDYVPIEYFYDCIDGGGHTIKNLTISSTGDCVGLFKNFGKRAFYPEYFFVTGSIINLKFENVNITGNNFVGALAGKLVALDSDFAQPEIENVEILSGTINGKDYVGGLVGGSVDNYIVTTKIKNCTNRADITGESNVGGIFGSVSMGEDAMDLVGFKNYGKVTGESIYYPLVDSEKMGNVGGITGAFTTDKKTFQVVNCYNYGDVTCEDNYYVGGLIGNVYYKHISSYYSSHKNGAVFKNSANYGDIKGRSFVGGIVGQTGGNFTGDSSLIDRTKFSRTEFFNADNFGSVEGYGDMHYASSGVEGYEFDGQYVGGIIGRDVSTEATFTSCNNRALAENEIPEGVNYQAGERYIRGCGHVGGISGAYGASWVNCSNDMDIYIGSEHVDDTNLAYAGGICAETFSVNGLVAYNPLRERVFDNCVNRGDILRYGRSIDMAEYATYTTEYVGGIAGYAGRVNMDDCENTGDVHGTKKVGGLFGSLNGGSAASISTSENTGKIYAYKGALSIGGIIGMIEGVNGAISINNVKTAGSIELESAGTCVAGVIGFWGEELYLLFPSMNATNEKFSERVTISNLTYNITFGTVSDKTMAYFESVIGLTSTEDDDLSINDSYTKTVHESILVSE